MHIRYGVLSVVLLGSMLTGTAWSDSPESASLGGQSGAPSPAMSTPALEAMEQVRKGLSRLEEFVTAPSTPDQQEIADFLDRSIAPYFDFAAMAQWAAGPAYSGLSEQDRGALTESVKEHFLATLGMRLLGAGEQPVQILPPRVNPRGGVAVMVLVGQPGPYSTRLLFRLYRTGDAWKVHDVVINGQSAVSYYRTMFQRMAMSGASWNE